MEYRRPVKEKVSIVRDSFSKYLGVSLDTPVIITDHDKPKSVLISYEDYIKNFTSAGKSKNYKKNKGKTKFSKFSDFKGIANPEKKKININKELAKGWIKDY